MLQSTKRSTKCCLWKYNHGCYWHYHLDCFALCQRILSHFKFKWNSHNISIKYVLKFTVTQQKLNFFFYYCRISDTSSDFIAVFNFHITFWNCFSEWNQQRESIVWILFLDIKLIEFLFNFYFLVRPFQDDINVNLKNIFHYCVNNYAIFLGTSKWNSGNIWNTSDFYGILYAAVSF